MTADQWASVPGYEGRYEVNRDGQVRSLDRIAEHYDGGCHRVRERILRPCRVNGHEAVWLCRDGRYKTVYVRKLVRQVFGNNR
jgi:hypothetical protein